MSELNQLLVFSVIIILTAIISIIGWQIFEILSEIRKILQKFNRLADNAISTSETIGNSFKSIKGFSKGIESALKLLNILPLGKKKKNPDEK